MNQENSRIVLNNAYNVRDLGGYAGLDDKYTKQRIFIRSDDLARLDEEEITYLKAYGIGCVIDLRSAEEIQEYPDPFCRNPQVDYYHVPLMIEEIDDITKRMAEDPEKMLCEFYVGLLKNSVSAIKRVIEIIAQEEGGVLFHCAAGKDRTGIIAMLLLGMAGVSREDIVDNYQVTYEYIKENPLYKKDAEQFPEELMMSKSIYIETAVDFLECEFGGIIPYLESIGLREEVKRIQERFLGN